MTIQLYLVPQVHIDTGSGTEFAAPKYVGGRLTTALPGLEGIQWTWERLVWEDLAVLVADVDTAQDALLSGQSDVIAIPPLDNVVPNNGVRNTIRNYFEARNLPGTWVQTGMTYRAILRVVLGMFKFFGRMVSKVGKVFAGTGNVTLDTTVGELPAGVRTKLQEAADEFGLDYSAVTGSTTVRQLLKGMADQFGDVEYRIGGMVI